MKKLIDEWIVTVKDNSTYYTYCSLWDNPENDDKPFPNHQVGVGKTKEESLSAFMKHEEERQKLLEKIKEEVR